MSKASDQNTDLYHFWECDLNKDNLVSFANSLSPRLRQHFVNSMGGLSLLDRDCTNVLQGYQGPKPNGATGDDSKKLEPNNGLQEVKFWWGPSKHLNWFPLVGSVVFGIARAASDTSDHSLYFDSETGVCLSHNKNEAASKLSASVKIL